MNRAPGLWNFGAGKGGTPAPPVVNEIPAVIFTRASADYLEWFTDPTATPNIVRIRRRTTNLLVLNIDPLGVNQNTVTTLPVLAIDGPTAILWSITPTETQIGFQNQNGGEVVTGAGWPGLTVSGVELWTFNSDNLLMKLKHSHDTPNSLWVGINDSAANPVDGDLHGTATAGLYIDWANPNNREMVWDSALDTFRFPGGNGENWFNQVVPVQSNADPAATVGRNRGSGPDADLVQVTGDGISPGPWSNAFIPPPATESQASQFDGLTNFLQIPAPGPAGIANGTEFTWDRFVKFEGGDGVLQTLAWIGTGAAYGLKIERLANNLVQAEWRTGAGVVIGTVVSTSTVTIASGWTRIGLDINGTSAVLRIGIVDESNNTPGTPGTIALADKWTEGKSDDGLNTNFFNGCMAEVWASDTSLGLGTNDIDEQFIDYSNNRPRDILSDGTGPDAGVSVYLSNDTPIFNINNAPPSTDYALTGALADCPGPGAYSPQHIPSGPVFAPAVGWPGANGEGFQDANTNTGLVDGKEFSYSYWAFAEPGIGNRRIYESPGQRLQMNASGSQRMQIVLKDSSGTNIFFWDTATNGWPYDNVWRHTCGYFNSASLNDFGNFLNGVSLGEAAITFTLDGIIDFTDLGIVVGAQNNGNAAWFGGISQLAIWPRKIDWGVPSNLALVYGSGGEAIILPDDGNIDGLGAANFVFNKPLATANLNGGTADDWAAATAGLTDIQGPAT